MIQRWIIAACILVTLETTVSAQPPGRGGFRGFFGGRSRLLVESDEVRKELGVDQQQAELLDALQADLAAQRRAILAEDQGPRTSDETVEQLRRQQLQEKLADFNRRSETLVAVVLEPAQATRLFELYLQREGLRAFDRPEVATKIDLSAEQQERLQALRQTLVDNRPRRNSRQQQAELREKEAEALRELLSDEQEKVWEQLLGKPFDFSASFSAGSRSR